MRKPAEELGDRHDCVWLPGKQLKCPDSATYVEQFK